jgi:hypothetical protein
MKIDGGCHCGYITYEATVDAEHVGICHCTDCQTFSGSAFRTGVLASKDQFRVLTGKPKIYVKTAQSGARRAQAFCPECGTHVYSSAPDDPQVFSIRTATARQRDQLIPSAQIWCRSAQPWAMNLSEMKKFPEQSPSRP